MIGSNTIPQQMQVSTSLYIFFKKCLHKLRGIEYKTVSLACWAAFVLIGASNTAQDASYAPSSCGLFCLHGFGLSTGLELVCTVDEFVAPNVTHIYDPYIL